MTSAHAHRSQDLIDALLGVPPFDAVPASLAPELSRHLTAQHVAAGQEIFAEGALLPGLFVILSGQADIFSGSEDVLSRRGPGDMLGDRGLMRGGIALLTARATEPCEVLVLPAAVFRRILKDVPEIAGWFARAVPSGPKAPDSPFASGLMSVRVADMMAAEPITCAVQDPVTQIAKVMRDRTISSVLVMEGDTLAGIVTVHDLVNKVLAEGLGGDVPASRIMTVSPVTITPEAVGLDALLIMAERGISHLPVADAQGHVLGMVGRTDLFRRQAATASHMAADIVAAESASDMARVMKRLPDLLTHLIASGARPDAICRRITDLSDAVTRRLLALAEARLGPPPVDYLWAACGSQGRREQTGVSDQDNCLILSDDMSPADAPYFDALARHVSDGLHEVGFVYCPGDMMATNPRWRQPLSVWRSYFDTWIRQPDGEAQMLASVMFDLRPIAGNAALFEALQADTLRQAQANSIFLRHLANNALGHRPPLSLFGRLSVIRSGDHRNTLDLKHSGVVPIVDLARVYALQGQIRAVNTRDRLTAAMEAGVLSQEGGRDLLDAHDFIASTRLRHQARQITEGRAPDNFLAPAQLSDLERNHLRDAFLVVRTMQSALDGKG